MAITPTADPIELFNTWYRQVLTLQIKEPTSVILATCSKDCIPSARVVLLKEHSAEGFVFFTNVNSRKGKELTENPKAALVFHWMELSRQVRIEGKVQLLDGNKADNYYSSRSRASQISAWCSKQSSTLKNWQAFKDKIELMTESFRDKLITRPDFWVGFCVMPEIIEFWQKGEHRNHIRYRYQFIKKDVWKIDQLYP